LTQPYSGDANGGIFVETVTHTTQLFLNKAQSGAGAGFKPGITAGLDACPAPGVAVGDFNNDGFLDVLCAGSSPTRGLIVFQVRLSANRGDGTFKTSITTVASTSSGTEVAPTPSGSITTSAAAPSAT
jgi:hypothetical protein